MPKNSPKIYTVTTLKKGSVVSTTHGFFYDKDKALSVVERNVCDIFEHYYDYAVVEEYDPGLYPAPSEIAWFKLIDYVNGEALIEKMSERPEEYKEYASFGIN